MYDIYICIFIFVCIEHIHVFVYLMCTCRDAYTHVCMGIVSKTRFAIKRTQNIWFCSRASFFFVFLPEFLGMEANLWNRLTPRERERKRHLPKFSVIFSIGLLMSDAKVECRLFQGPGNPVS